MESKDNKSNTTSPIMHALGQFERAEANLCKLERMAADLESGRLERAAYGSTLRSYEMVLNGLPKIEGWRPSALPLADSEVSQLRFDAAELGEISIIASAEESISAYATQLARYKHDLDTMRRALVRNAILKHRTFNPTHTLLRRGSSNIRVG